MWLVNKTKIQNDNGGTICGGKQYLYFYAISYFHFTFTGAGVVMNYFTITLFSVNGNKSDKHSIFIGDLKNASNVNRSVTDRWTGVTWIPWTAEGENQGTEL